MTGFLSVAPAPNGRPGRGHPPEPAAANTAGLTALELSYTRLISLKPPYAGSEVLPDRSVMHGQRLLFAVRLEARLVVQLMTHQNRCRSGRGRKLSPGAGGRAFPEHWVCWGRQLRDGLAQARGAMTTTRRPVTGTQTCSPLPVTVQAACCGR